MNQIINPLQNKMKKNLYLFVAIVMAVMSVSFMSCGDEPSELEAQLIGEWYTGPGGYWDDVHHIKFNSNHTGNYWVVEMDEVCEEFNFKWSVKGDILTFKCDNPEFYEYVFETGDFYFRNNKLYLPNADGGYGMDFIRVQ